MTATTTTTTTDSIETTTLNTIHLLQSRLHRLTYLLTGDTAWTGKPNPPARPESLDESVSRRLVRLERELEGLRGGVPLVGDVLGLYDRFPDLFRPSQQSQQQSPSTDPSDPSTSETPDSPTDPQKPAVPDLPPSTLLSIILSYATTIPETASRLTSLTDTPIPDPTLSSSLIALQPRMDKLSEVQDKQAAEVAELRVRTAKVLRRVYEVSILGGGEVWGEWEGRIEGVERGVRRGEIAREREGV